MRLHRRRQPEPVEVVSTMVDIASSIEDIAPPKPKRRRTSAEVANDRIIAEQTAAAEHEVELQRVRDEVRREWEQGRRGLPREPFNSDGRFVY
jgi:hypothetical protein